MSNEKESMKKELVAACDSLKQFRHHWERGAELFSTSDDIRTLKKAADDYYETGKILKKRAIELEKQAAELEKRRNEESF